MKLLPRGSWSYAVLLVLLFSIAAIATKQVIDSTAEHFILPEHEGIVREFSTAIWLLTMGLMFLAGALGLLAISTTAEYESRHRIARLVNMMSYLSDGLLALDYQGYIKGANPAVRQLAPGYLAGLKKGALGKFFPSLKDDDIKRLLNRYDPGEIEIECSHPSGSRILRLRSQPTDGMLLMFVSDITEKHSLRLRQQQAGKLQLLGRIAGGVAHDFSNILGAISGHAFLMQRFGGDQRSLAESVEIIQKETERGVRLSRQLLVLSRSSESLGQSSDNLVANVREAEELLRVALSSLWRIESSFEGVFPLVPLSPSQIVQIILNLALLAADALKKPGKLLIQVKPWPVQGRQPDDLAWEFSRSSFRRRSESYGGQVAGGSTEANFAAIITIAASAVDANNADKGMEHHLPPGTTGIIDTTGVIPSVVRALIEDSGGQFDELYASKEKIIYRVYLPRASAINQSGITPLQSVINGRLRLKKWHILMALSDHRNEINAKKLEELGAAVEKKSSIETIIGAIESERKPDVIIVDKSFFGDHADSLLKAVRKISPVSGIVVMCARPEEEALRNERGFIFINSDSGTGTMLEAIVMSRQTFAP